QAFVVTHRKLIPGSRRLGSGTLQQSGRLLDHQHHLITHRHLSGLGSESRTGSASRSSAATPDSATAPVVRWMFAQRVAGHSTARITRALNHAGIPCPSAADPKRNPHRTGTAWTLRT